VAEGVKTLIHVHTDYSFDSDLTLGQLVGFLAEEDFGCVAVTDHDTIEGALRLRGMTDARVIVGEEISTREGHLIGLFLDEPIPPGLSARATALAIRAQGGLVLLPHPFVRFFGCGLREGAWQIADLVDAVEVNNAQNPWPSADRAARVFAEALDLPQYAGADSHTAASIAPCWQVLPAFDGPAGFLQALGTARLAPGRHPLSYFIATGWRVARYLTGLGLPSNFGAHAAPAPSVARGDLSTSASRAA
jgi:predicted metal-dependent phosphoesterase TrpH